MHLKEEMRRINKRNHQSQGGKACQQQEKKSINEWVEKSFSKQFDDASNPLVKLITEPIKEQELVKVPNTYEIHEVGNK